MAKYEVTQKEYNFLMEATPVTEFGVAMTALFFTSAGKMPSSIAINAASTKAGALLYGC